MYEYLLFLWYLYSDADMGRVFKKLSDCFAFHWCVTCLMSVVYCLVFFDVSVVGYFMRCWLFLDILTIFLNYKVGWHKNLVPVCLASEVF